MYEQKTAQLLDGKAVAASVREGLKLRVDSHVRNGVRAPGLAVVLVGDNPASHLYVKNKIQACKKTGIESHLRQFPENASLADILACLKELNESEAIDGILVQLPLPSHLNSEVVLSAVRPDKDVDGLHPVNLGLLLSGRKGLRPCTPAGVMVLLDHYEIPLGGKTAVVVGRSNLVGKPVALMLMERNATVTICHSRSLELDRIVQKADIVVAAAGKEHLVRGSWIKPGAVVVDVGIHRRQTPDGQSEVVGDVDFAEAAAVASHITPVPGGVGPMTVAMLLSNTLEAYEQHISPR
ncbi:MAG TPA: bifunctional methylenetetrahydrofolate dehydrogenase/methenyltetrahydrofolate cyclohydrolase FolD [Candidatus Obscuribacterales bacterium]